ncbi:FtsX-like permease family protein [Cytobacillus sp. Hz8]|uniref:ABC transporter permease n=1 Tax=Cytobacillus sp. Hz8 TaxID=3347168 RepID=UPI0035DC4025
MTLFSLAMKNIKGNFKSYLIYFISMLFSVVIYYTFVSLQYSEEIQEVIESSKQMQSTFLVSSIILILFVTIFIWYSNSFFTKKRKKEVGLYSLLGLRKKSIGKMLFYENLIMGILVLFMGILLGSFLTRLFSMMLMKLLDAEVNIHFSLSFEAIANTLIVFAIIIIFTSIQGYRLIYRFKLIELFQAEKEGDSVLKGSMVAAVISLVCLGVSYWQAFEPFPANLTNAYVLGKISWITGGIVIGTFLLFRSVTVYLLKVAQKNKSRYYRGMNLVGISQLLYRIKANAQTFTMIALLSALTLSAICITYSQYYGTKEHADAAMPFSYSHLSKGADFDQRIRDIIMSDKNHPVTAEIDIPVIKLDGKKTEELPEYLAGIMDVAKEKPGEKPIRLISESTYSQALKVLNKEESVNLQENQTAVIKPMSTNPSLSDYKGHKVTLKLPQGKKTLEFTDMLEERVMAWTYPDFYIVVTDQIYNQIAKQVKPSIFKAYQVKNQKTTKETSDRLEKLDTSENQKVTFFNMYKTDSKISTYYTVYRAGVEETGLNIFTIGFLGLVFLAATGSILYFKQLTEANSDKCRYEILRKIGVSRKEIYRSIAKQSLFVFALPLIVGVMHSFVILEVLNNMLSDVIGVNLTIPIISSMIAYIMIYFGYYVLTVKTYNNIVN